jgi:hypothetical protein
MASIAETCFEAPIYLDEAWAWEKDKTVPGLLHRVWGSSTWGVLTRKYRLMALACCSLITDLLAEDYVQFLDRVYGYADRGDSEAIAPASDLALMKTRAHDDALKGKGDDPRRCAVSAIHSLIRCFVLGEQAQLHEVFYLTASAGAQFLGTDLIRDIVGNPSCPPILSSEQRRLGSLTQQRTVSSFRDRAARGRWQRVERVMGIYDFAAPIRWLSWDGGIVKQLAQGIYEEQAFDRMPILADALEEAGCENAIVLAHCRHDHPHYRGCWVIDHLLGKG